MKIRCESTGCRAEHGKNDVVLTRQIRGEGPLCCQRCRIAAGHDASVVAREVAYTERRRKMRQGQLTMRGFL